MPLSETGRASAICCVARVPCDTCLVRPLAICGALSPDELPRLAAIALPRHLESGVILLQEGEPASDVFTLVSGMIKLYKLLSDGRRQITGFMVPGDFIGLGAPNGYIYNAEAIGRTRLCRFRVRQLQAIMDDYPNVERRLLARVTSDLAAAHDQMLLLGRKTARERLASFILELARRQALEDGDTLPLPMSRTDIADYLGLTIETVSRTFTGLRREGLVSLPNASSAVLRDVEGLREIAGE